MPYFDHNATSPLRPVAREAWLEACESAWQNPASPYRDAAKVRLRAEVARERLAPLFGCAEQELVCTSGATEAASAVLHHLARRAPPTSRIALNPAEHPAVREAARAAWGETRVWFLPVDEGGVVQPATLESALAGGDIAAVAVMAANNETGVLQPWPTLAAVARARGVAFVCDATQWLGKLPAAGLGEVDWVFGSAHKFGGPKGVGILKVPSGSRPLTSAADHTAFVIGHHNPAQQRGWRAGTEDYPGMAALVAALLEAETRWMPLETERTRWRDAFVRRVQAALPGARVLAAGAERLWNTVALQLPHGDHARWVARLDKRGFQVSTGAACATGADTPSPTLAALGLDAMAARRVVRVSSAWSTTEAEWQALAEALVAVAPEVMPAPEVVTG